jgi:phage virion morphogenesis protein
MSDFDRIGEIIGRLIRIDMTPLYSEIGGIVEESVDRNFREGGRFAPGDEPGEWVGGSQRWLPSQRAQGSTSKERRRKTKGSGAAGQTLLDTGRLAASLTYQVSPNGVTFGTNVIYGAIHHFGGQAGRKRSVTLPARPWLVIQEEDYSDIEEAVERFFNNRFQ